MQTMAETATDTITIAAPPDDCGQQSSSLSGVLNIRDFITSAIVMGSRM